MSWFRKRRIKFDSTLIEERPGFVLVRCVGEYREGSAGNPDAQAIIEYCRRVIEKTGCEGIVLDYRELTYTWGDLIEATLDIAIDDPIHRFRHIPTVFVAGDPCREALGTLFDDDYDEVCCEGVEDAVALLEKRLYKPNEEAQQGVGGQPATTPRVGD